MVPMFCLCTLFIYGLFRVGKVLGKRLKRIRKLQEEIEQLRK